MTERLDRIEDKVEGNQAAIGEVRERVAGIDATQRATWGAVKATRSEVSELGRRLTKHVDEEAATFRGLAKDVHFLRGVIEERERWKAKNPIVRAVLWVLGLFGVRVPGK